MGDETETGALSDLAIRVTDIRRRTTLSTGSVSATTLSWATAPSTGSRRPNNAGRRSCPGRSAYRCLFDPVPFLPPWPNIFRCARRIGPVYMKSELYLVTCEGNDKRDLSPLLFVHDASHGAWSCDKHFLDRFADHGLSAFSISLCANVEVAFRAVETPAGRTTGRDRLWPRAAPVVGAKVLDRSTQAANPLGLSAAPRLAAPAPAHRWRAGRWPPSCLPNLQVRQSALMGRSPSRAIWDPQNQQIGPAAVASSSRRCGGGAPCMGRSPRYERATPMRWYGIWMQPMHGSTIRARATSGNPGFRKRCGHG